MVSRISSIHRHIAPCSDYVPACSTRPAATSKARQKLQVGMVGLGGRGTGTLGTIEGSALLAEKMEMVALADVDADALEPHKSKGYALFSTASELIQVSPSSSPRHHSHDSNCTLAALTRSSTSRRCAAAFRVVSSIHS